MSVIGNPLLLSPEGYQISRSVRLRSSASAYFNRTPASAGNLSTWTWSAWVKRGTLSSGYQTLLMGGTTADNNTLAISFTPSDTLQIQGYSTTYFTSNQVFRDPSAWYHIVVGLDSTQATQANRCKVYVNGALITGSTNAVPLNGAWNLNNNVLQTIGYQSAVWGFTYFDGYMTEMNFVNAQQLTASSFGTTDAFTGAWVPMAYTGTYGTNGFYLNFKDNTSTTTLGYDYSGNSNNWTANNISVTAGVTYDSMIDTPTPYADGGNGRGNYAVLNAVQPSSVSVTDGNLGGYLLNAAISRQSTIGVSSGKYYFEMYTVGRGGIYNNLSSIGVSTASESLSNYVGSGAGGWGFIPYDGSKVNNNTGTAYGSGVGSGDSGWIGCAIDMDAGKIWWRNSSGWFASGDPAAGTNAAYTNLAGNTVFPAIGNAGGGHQGNYYVNFGQRPFAYTPPTGFKALNTQNLPEPTIKKGNQYFDVSLFTGTGSAQTITNSGAMQPDLVWVKGRGEVASHRLVDAVRGVDKVIYTNQTAAEVTEDGVVDSFNSNGFTGGGANAVTSGYAGVAWQWRASNAAAVSNTDGSITSTVSAGVTQGFSVVTYTGTGAAGATVGHGLGAAPRMIVLKDRTNARNWIVYQATLGNTAAAYLNLTNAADVGYSQFWNNTSPTSSNFTVSTWTNESSANYVAYCFAEVPGFSKFGSYTGNGSADGPFQYLGFAPAFIMLKRTDSTGNWSMYDRARSPKNADTKVLYPNLSNAEDASTDHFDWLSNGFKMKSTNQNTSGGTFIYMAFAESPFKNSLAR